MGICVVRTRKKPRGLVLWTVSPALEWSHFHTGTAIQCVAWSSASRVDLLIDGTTAVADREVLQRVRSDYCQALTAIISKNEGVITPSLILLVSM